MKLFFASILLSIAFALMGGGTAVAQKLQWQRTDTVIETASVNNPEECDGVAIYSQNLSIIISTNHSVEVRVFTILGQLISNGKVPAGTSILNVNSRGIYIVKIGNITQKVAL